MMYAYDEMYLNDAMKNLGEAFDYSCNVLNIPMDDFLDMFIVSGISEQFACGNPRVLSGLSGTELVYEVLNRMNIHINLCETQIEYEYSSEYWCGWILAYYQWNSGKNFKEIKKYISMNEIHKLYSTLHEASEEKFNDVVNAIYEHKKLPAKLKTIRKAAGLSQKELSEKSGVTLRMVQQYEQRVKDINKSSASNLFALAKTLGCKAEDLLE